MAERRMFSSKIVDSDAFLDMPVSGQCLYFHLGMRADDDGFVGNPKKIMRMVGGNDDDLKLLLVKRFILGFDSGVVVIKHWLIHNLIRKDRYRETQYLEEKNKLNIKTNLSYTEKDKEKLLSWQPNGNQMATQDRLGKDRLGKDRDIVAPEVATPFSFKEYLEEMQKNKQRHIQVVALYWKLKGWRFENLKQAEKAIKRELRPAQNLADYTDQEIIKAAEYIDGLKDMPKWTLETVFKYIDDIRAGKY